MNTTVLQATTTMVERINAHIVANNKTGMHQDYVKDQQWKITEGRKYLKLIAIGGASAFVDKMTGEIYKPASFAAPAKGVRGNVLSTSNGDEALVYWSGMMLVTVQYK